MQIRGHHPFTGLVDVPGDKSESHRVVLISALAEGLSRIEGLSNGDDVARTVAAVSALGGAVVRDGSALLVTGGLHAAPNATVDLGNSGTGLRLLVGAVAGRGPGLTRFVGDESLSARPMDRVTLPLTHMGAVFRGQGPHLSLPLEVDSPAQLQGITYDVPVPSAQVKGAILFAGLRARAATTVIERVDTRHATEDLLREAGIAIHSSRNSEGHHVHQLEPGIPSPRAWHVARDPSQAAFFLTAGALAPGGSVRINNLVRDPARWGYLSVLERSGAQVTRMNDGRDIEVQHGSIRPFVTNGSEIVGLDEVPILTVWALMASGRSTFTNVGELRHKEVDRLAACAQMVQLFGASATIEGDDLHIDGLGGAPTLSPTIGWRHDHRMVMASAVAASLGSGCTLTHPDATASSFPTFFDALDSLR